MIVYALGMPTEYLIKSTQSFFILHPLLKKYDGLFESPLVTSLSTWQCCELACDRCSPLHTSHFPKSFAFNERLRKNMWQVRELLCPLTPKLYYVSWQRDWFEK